MILRIRVPARSVKRNADYFGIAGYFTSLHGIDNVQSRHDGQETEIFEIHVIDHFETISAHLKEICERRGWKMEDGDARESDSGENAPSSASDSSS